MGHGIVAGEHGASNNPDATHQGHEVEYCTMYLVLERDERVCVINLSILPHSSGRQLVFSFCMIFTGFLNHSLATHV